MTSGQRQERPSLQGDFRAGNPGDGFQRDQIGIALDAILSAKISQAKALGIAVTVKANVPDRLLLYSMRFR